eukprot:m.21784 g.21784  ORF g.21784 m.21784 type:complete len:775 (+) comp6559_c0_seq1:258-2582(+)
MAAPTAAMAPSNTMPSQQQQVIEVAMPVTVCDVLAIDLCEWVNNTLGAIVTTPPSIAQDLATGSLLCRLAFAMEEGRVLNVQQRLQKVRRRQAMEAQQQQQSRRGGPQPPPSPEIKAELDAIAAQPRPALIKYQGGVKPGSAQARDNVMRFLAWCDHAQLSFRYMFTVDEVLATNRPAILRGLFEVSRAQTFIAPSQLALIDRQVEMDGVCITSQEEENQIIAAVKQMVKTLPVQVEHLHASTFSFGDLLPTTVTCQLRGQVLARYYQQWVPLATIVFNPTNWMTQLIPDRPRPDHVAEGGMYAPPEEPKPVVERSERDVEQEDAAMAGHPGKLMATIKRLRAQLKAKEEDSKAKIQALQQGLKVALARHDEDLEQHKIAVEAKQQEVLSEERHTAMLERQIEQLQADLEETEDACDRAKAEADEQRRQLEHANQLRQEVLLALEQKDVQARQQVTTQQTRELQLGAEHEVQIAEVKLQWQETHKQTCRDMQSKFDAELMKVETARASAESQVLRFAAERSNLESQLQRANEDIETLHDALEQRTADLNATQVDFENKDRECEDQTLFIQSLESAMDIEREEKTELREFLEAHKRSKAVLQAKLDAALAENRQLQATQTDLQQRIVDGAAALQAAEAARNMEKTQRQRDATTAAHETSALHQALGVSLEESDFFRKLCQVRRGDVSALRSDASAATASAVGGDEALQREKAKTINLARQLEALRNQSRDQDSEQIQAMQRRFDEAKAEWQSQLDAHKRTLQNLQQRLSETATTE